MLTRIYVDNFRCLVNFELKLDRLNLLLGENGSGKSTVFEVLRRLQGFIGGNLRADEAFPSDSLTRWQNLDTQRFELELKSEEKTYIYSLAIEHTGGEKRTVRHEKLTVGGYRLIEFDGEGVALFDDGGKVPFPSDLGQSPVGFYQGIPSLKLLQEFCKKVARILVARPMPAVIASKSGSENRDLDSSGANYASWYRYLSQEHQGNIVDLTQELRKVIDGFDSIILREAGDGVRVLTVRMRNAKDAKPLPYNFDELSDGQRQLILLYTLLYGVKGEGYCLFLDEPDNFVALREIQPWLTALQDACGNEISQAVLISHHPEITDYLASSVGRWFERPDNGPVRVRDMPPPTDGLSQSETIARGWVE